MPTDRPLPAPFDASPTLFPAEWQALSAAFADSGTGLLFMRDGIITNMNPALAARLNFVPTDLIGKPVTAILFSGAGPLPESNLNGSDDAGKIIRFGDRSGRPVDFHLIATRYDNSPDAADAMWILQSLSPADEWHTMRRAQRIIEQLPEPILICTAEAAISYASPAFDALVGDHVAPIGMPGLFDLAEPEDRPGLRAALGRLLGGEDVRFSLRLRGQDGRRRRFACSGRNLLAQGEVNGLLLTLHAIDEQDQELQRSAAEKKRQLHYLTRLLRLALHPHPHQDSALKAAMKAAAKALGAHCCAYWEAGAEPAAARCLIAYDDVRQNLVSEEPDAQLAAAFPPLLRQVLLDGRPLVVADVDQDPRTALACEYFHAAGIKALMMVPVHGAGLLALSQSLAARDWRKDEAEFAMQCADLVSLMLADTARGRPEPQQPRPAHQDSLTGLPNRQFLFERAAELFSKMTAQSASLAAFFIDLDRFRHVNEALGHATGDELLKAVALRLQNLVRKDDVLARLGGDEFMLLAQNLDDMRVAEDIAQQIVDAMNAPFSLRGHELQVSVSVGIALYPFDGGDIDTLMKKADIALFHAKSGGRNRYQLFSPRQAGRVSTQSVLEGELRRAMREHELQHYYQPQVDLRTGKVRCVEALLRWHHPRHGLLLPVAFLPLAERSGLIRTISHWVMNDVCDQLRAWREKGLEGLERLSIAVNLAAGQLMDDSLAATLEDALERTGVQAAQLEWEVRESTVMRHDAMSTSLLDRMAELQIGLSIDDFGTGYSNLGYLRRYPVRKVKIDRSLISALPDESDGRAITDAIILMAQPLGLDVVAEGVETPQQMEYLRAHGCHIAQGYYFTQPLTAEQFETWLIRH